MKGFLTALAVLAVVVLVIGVSANTITQSPQSSHSNLCFKQVIEHNDHYPMQGQYPNGTVYYFNISISFPVLTSEVC